MKLKYNTIKLNQNFLFWNAIKIDEYKNIIIYIDFKTLWKDININFLKIDIYFFTF